MIWIRFHIRLKIERGDIFSDTDRRDRSSYYPCTIERERERKSEIVGYYFLKFR